MAALINPLTGILDENIEGYGHRLRAPEPTHLAAADLKEGDRVLIDDRVVTVTEIQPDGAGRYTVMVDAFDDYPWASDLTPEVVSAKAKRLLNGEPCGFTAVELVNETITAIAINQLAGIDAARACLYLLGLRDADMLP